MSVGWKSLSGRAAENPSGLRLVSAREKIAQPSQAPAARQSDQAARVTIAVLIASYNRKAKTLACLDALFRQADLDQCELSVFLVDDGSTDGTAEAVCQDYPQVRLLCGDGSLYWGGSMRLAFETALQAAESFTYYFWLNDDTFLRPDALKRLILTHQELAQSKSPQAIIVGTTIDPHTNKLSYGGQRLLWPLPFLYIVRPSTVPVRCTTMGGNCVLIPDSVARKIGNIDPVLVHPRGDLDYGFRASSLGCDIWVAPGLYASCEANPIGAWHNLQLPLHQRLAALHETKYAISQKNLLARRYYGPLWFLSSLMVYGYIWLSHPLRLVSFFRKSREKAD